MVKCPEALSLLWNARDDRHGSPDAARARPALRFHVPILAPMDAPTVLDEPVVGTVLRAVAHHGHGVGEHSGAASASAFAAAGTTVKHPAAAIQVEGGEVGEDGDKHGAVAVHQSSQECFRAPVGREADLDWVGFWGLIPDLRSPGSKLIFFQGFWSQSCQKDA